MAAAAMSRRSKRHENHCVVSFVRRTDSAPFGVQTDVFVDPRRRKARVTFTFSSMPYRCQDVDVASPRAGVKEATTAPFTESIRMRKAPAGRSCRI
jgi:hypothetical protein